MYSLTISVIVFIIGEGCADDSFFNKYSMISDIDNYQNQTIGSFVSKNDVQCAVACAQTPACVAFFFSKTAQQCILQGTFVEMETDHGTSLLFKYWRKSLGDTNTKLMRECPPDYTYNGLHAESCYKFVRNKRKTIEDASLACQNEDSHLVFVETLEERDLIQGIFRTSMVLHQRKSYWTGGIRDGSAWRWGIGGEKVSEEVASGRRKHAHKVLKFYDYDETEYILKYVRGTALFAYICEFELLRQN